MMAKAKCFWCGEELTFNVNRGWVHPEGGSYMQRCKRCGWKGAPHPSPWKCPKCGSDDVVDDHAALPVEN